MPRASDGTYSLPAGNPVTTLTTISSTWANTTLDDLGDAMTDSLSRSGDGGMLAALELDDGLIGAPGLAFASEPTLGIWRSASNTLQAVVAGTNRLTVNASGAAVTGTLSASGAVTLSSTLAVTGAVTLSDALTVGTTLGVTGIATFTDDILAADGDATSPGIAFSADTDTGIYRGATNALSIATAGTQRVNVTTAAFGVTLPIRSAGGTAAAPAFSVTGDTDTGFYSDVADQVYFAEGGSGFRVGFREVPQNIQNGNYTAVLTDNGKHIYKASGGAGETYTIPANASVAYPIGTVLTFVNQGGGTLTIAITTDTMTLAGTGSTGSRTLADDGVATALKVAAAEWIISGTGLT